MLQKQVMHSLTLQPWREIPEGGAHHRVLSPCSCHELTQCWGAARRDPWA
jgi:hypothetical protein